MLWNFLWLLVLLCECILVPYTVCLDKNVILGHTRNIEIVIDFLWILHMFFTVTTSYYSDLELITDLKSIGLKYAKELLWLDLLTTLPSIITWYTINATYYAKILRCFYILKATSILKGYILTLESMFNLSK